MVTTTIMTVIAFLLLFIAGVSKAVMDKVNFHYYSSVFKKFNSSFWDPFYSCLNKYKDGTPMLGPRFFGSTTFLVWTTDAWHLFQIINGITFATAFVLLGMNSPWWVSAIGYAFSRGVFEVFFKYIFTANKNRYV